MRHSATGTRGDHDGVTMGVCFRDPALELKNGGSPETKCGCGVECQLPTRAIAVHRSQ